MRRATLGCPPRVARVGGFSPPIARNPPPLASDPVPLPPQGTPTCTPRLVLFDLCGSMGGVRRAGYLYDDPAGPGSGSGSGSDLPRS